MAQKLNQNVGDLFDVSSYGKYLVSQSLKGSN